MWIEKWSANAFKSCTVHFGGNSRIPHLYKCYWDTNSTIVSPYLTFPGCELYLVWQPTRAIHFSGLSNVWKGCCQGTVFTFLYAHTWVHALIPAISVPFLSNVTPPRWQLAASCFFNQHALLHVVKPDVFVEINCLPPPSSPPLFFLCLLLFTFTALMCSNYLRRVFTTPPFILCRRQFEFTPFIPPSRGLHPKLPMLMRLMYQRRPRTHTHTCADTQEKSMGHC